MNDDSKKVRQPLALACTHFVALTKTALTDSDCRALDSLLSDCQTFQALAETASTQSFLTISQQIERLLLACRASGRCLNPLEKEVVELGVDWLEQLSRLYGEGLPEPESLLKELIYAFELVGKSLDAASLSDLLASRTLSDGSSDMFAHDPEPAVNHYRAPQQSDPFAGDPGFGMEFDLLQRTFNLSSRQQMVIDDLFRDDNHFDDVNDSVRTDTIPYDVFADDPEPEG